LIIDTDGSVHVVIVQDLRRLAACAVREALSRDLEVVQKETWSLIGGGMVRGEVSTAARGALGSGFGTVLMAPRNGSGLKCTATVEFKVPLIGGKIESYVGRQMVEETCNAALHYEVDHGACLTPLVLRCGTPRCVERRIGLQATLPISGIDRQIVPG
jgi:xanthine/CO dehydrogenase XdhC/CoxF family maturation factor